MRVWTRIAQRREFTIVVVLIVLVTIFSILNPEFLEPDNIFVILRGGAFIGVMAVGVAWILISGSFDLSTGAVAGMATVIASTLIMEAGVPIVLSVICGCLSGMVIGLVNYYMVFKVHLPAFLATIGTMFISKGIGMYISKGWEIYPLPESLGVFGNAQPLEISWHFWIFVFLIIISQLFLSFSLWGLEVKATGSDREIARLTEVNIEKASLSTFLICGTLSAFAGILLMTRLGAGKPAIGTGWELQVITAVAIGGVSLFGYEGSFVGVFLGILAIQVIQNGLIAIGLSPYLNTIVVGVILLFTAFVDWKRRANLDILREQAG
jgi:ribose/xylose/arabinose/galactoside ABC-type transport system permease subunit